VDVAVDAKESRDKGRVEEREESLGDVQLRDKHAQLVDEQFEIRRLIACA
jgi:hypothetical protein